MDLQIIKCDPIMLIGIEDRTKNEDEVSGKGKIPNLIQTFYGEKLNGLSNRKDNQILAVYTDYEIGEHGYYTYFIGAKVKELSFIPEGMVGRVIPSLNNNN